jgi:hypothetical protein
LRLPTGYARNFHKAAMRNDKQQQKSENMVKHFKDVSSNIGIALRYCSWRPDMA